MRIFFPLPDPAATTHSAPYWVDFDADGIVTAVSPEGAGAATHLIGAKLATDNLGEGQQLVVIHTNGKYESVNNPIAKIQK